VAASWSPVPGDAPADPSVQSLTELPKPVARYLRNVLGERRPLLREARLKQVGQLRIDPGSNRWLGFEAEQVSRLAPPSFLWNSRVRLAPLLSMRVQDSYSDGIAAGGVKLLGIVPLGGDRGKPELNSGALHRFLAEAVWYPTALLPSRSLVWTPLDDTRALAILTDHSTTVSLEFRFNGADEVTGIYSPGRWGRFQGQYRQVPWEGHFQDYRRQQGLLVPGEGEVGWYSGGVWQCVWRGRIVQSQYRFQPEVGRSKEAT
jgi:uncharacterized protein DUF6544